MAAAQLLTVLHLMRTYGQHGGENQLASYLSAAREEEGVREIFAFVFRDDACRRLFAERGVRASLVDLWPTGRATAGAWREVLGVLARLPLLQWRLAGVLRRDDPRVCVVHGVQAALVAWPFALVRRLKGRRFVYVHRITKASGRSGPARLLYAPFDVLAGNSQAVAASLEGLTQNGRAVALDNGVDLRRLAAHAAEAPAGPVPGARADLVAVGRLLPHKNQRLLLEALARIVPARPETTLWLVGDGPERAALEARAAALGLSDRVVFTGQRSDVPALLARSRVFVNASLWEGMSNSVLEAMAMGLPSVVVDAPGVSECHEPGVTGLVVGDDPEAFAAAALRLLTDADEAAAVGRAARERIERHYSIEAARARYLDLYRRLSSGVV